MIDLLVGELSKRLFYRDVSILVKLYCINDIIVGDTTYHRRRLNFTIRTMKQCHRTLSQLRSVSTVLSATYS